MLDVNTYAQSYDDCNKTSFEEDQGGVLFLTAQGLSSRRELLGEKEEEEDEIKPTAEPVKPFSVRETSTIQTVSHIDEKKETNVNQRKKERKKEEINKSSIYIPTQFSG